MANNLHAFTNKQTNNSVAKKHKDLDLLNKALKKDKKQTTLDFYKIATGDYKENQRLKMKNYQEALKV